MSASWSAWAIGPAAAALALVLGVAARAGLFRYLACRTRHHAAFAVSNYSSRFWCSTCQRGWGRPR